MICTCSRIEASFHASQSTIELGRIVNDWCFLPTTFLQLGVYNTFLSIYLANTELNHVSEPKERDASEVNEAIKEPLVQQFLFYWIVVVDFFQENLFANYTDRNFSCRCNCKLQSMLAPKSPTYSESKDLSPRENVTRPVSRPYSKAGQRLP